jgi:hypothetical protein
VSIQVIELAAAMWEGRSHSLIMRFWELRRRKAILHNLALEYVVVSELIEQFPSHESRNSVWRPAHEHLDMSNRKIAMLAGVSHPTVATGIRQAKDAV